MNTSMADGASERLDAQIADALFGQPGMSKLDVANRLRQLRGTGAPLLADVGNPVSVSLEGQGNALAKITVAQCPPGMSSDYAYGWNDCINALPAPPADDAWHLQGYAYASKQATNCAGCGKHKHTPLRIDAMGGYVCLICIDAKLSGMLREFGYPETHTAPGRWTQRHSEQLYDALNKGLTIHVGALSQKKRDAISAEVKRALIDCQTVSGEPNTAPIRPTDTAQTIDQCTGIQAITAERQRQLRDKEFSREGDQQYCRGELAKAATAYVQLAAMDLAAGGTREHIAWQWPAAVWPWEPEWWKPVNARRDLVRAGALIAAQIDLIDSKGVGNA